MWWYGREHKVALVEEEEQRQVYTIGVSPVACRNDTNTGKHRIQLDTIGKSP